MQTNRRATSALLNNPAAPAAFGPSLLSPARQIFAEKPLVAAAFRQEVPAKMNEMEFWERYFRYSRAMAKRRDNELRAIQRTQVCHGLRQQQ